MPYRNFLARVRRLFVEPSEHLDSIAEALAKGRLQQPVVPMSDQELAHAIREFQKTPPSRATLEQLGAEFSRK